MTRSPWLRRLTAATTGAVAITLVGGIAYATWSDAGGGAASAKVGTSTAITVAATVGSQLYPGSTADLVVTVSNPNVSAVTVTDLSLDGAVTATGGCTTPGVTVTLPSSVNLSVPAGGSAPLTLTNAVAMTTSSSSDCQGATFTIPLTASGQLP